MATLHLSAQGFERAELQLLDGAFGFVQATSDFADSALLDKAFVNNAALNGGELVDETKQAGVVVDGFEIRRGRVWVGGGLWRIVRGRLLAGGALVLIRKRIGGDAEEPGGEGSAAPFVVGKIGEGFVKDV
jgi:hypothetical protein